MIKRHGQDALVSLLFGSINVLVLWAVAALFIGTPLLQGGLLVAAALLWPISWFFTKRAWVGIGRPLLEQPVDFEHVASSGLFWGAFAGLAVFNLLMLLILGDAAASGGDIGTLLLGGALFYAFVGFVYGGVFAAALIGGLLGLLLLLLDASMLWLAQRLRAYGRRTLPGAR